MADQKLPSSLELIDSSDITELQESIKERVDTASRWMHDNYWGEFEEVWRAYKCKTKPIYKLDAAGNETTQEDKSRTNVAMPDINVVVRKNTARMTANMPKINYRGSDPLVGDKLTALAYQQFDRSGEARQHRKLVQGAETFGFYYSEVNWDELELTLPFRQPPEKIAGQFKNYSDILKFQGVPEDQIKAQLDQRPMGDQLTEEDRAGAMAQMGSEVIQRQSLRQYEGPVVKAIFPGNFTFDNEAECLNESSWCNKREDRDDLWLKKMAGVKFRHPATGEWFSAFDPKACEELLDSNTKPLSRDRTQDLKYLLRNVQGKSDPEIDRKLRTGKRKMFTVDHFDEVEDDGIIWITFVANEKYVIGRMPYQVDLGGRFRYTEFVPLPDMISAHGDSTPRLLRYLWNMHNATVAQNFDYVTALMKIFLLVQRNEDLSSDAIQRGWFRELKCADPRNIMPLQMPPMPAGALERESQILRMIGFAEPALNNIDSGTQNNPMAGKLATTALLAAKSSDAFTQFKLDSLNIYLKELGEKKLYMNQQLGSGWDISAKYPWSTALSERYGKVASIRLDVQEMQDFYEVEPEAGSMLAVNDELKRAAAQDLMLAASANPGIANQRKVFEFMLSTIPNIGPKQDYILPENPNPPAPEAKVSVSVSIPFDKLPPQGQAIALEKLLGEPLPPDMVQELNDKATMQGVKDVAEAASSAHDMLQEQPTPAEELAAKQKPNPKMAQGVNG